VAPLLLFEAAWTRARLGETRAHHPMLMARSRSARSGSTGELQTFEEGKQGVGCPVRDLGRAYYLQAGPELLALAAERLPDLGARS
jgi:hypothetical protein